MIGVHLENRYSDEECRKKDRSCKDKRRKDCLHCEGCICQMLCKLGSNQGVKLTNNRFYLKDKGTSEPLSLDGTGMPTLFHLVDFVEGSCCAIFEFEDMSGTTPIVSVKRKYITDCHNLGGIVIVEEDILSSFLSNL